MTEQAYSLGPDGWPDIPKVAPAPGQGRSSQGAIEYSQHPPLDPSRKEIRLLRVRQRRPHPDQPEYYQMVAELYTASLLDDPLPAYKALSYVWNDDLPLHNGRPDDFIKGKHTSLTMILKQLSRGGDMTLWVDALCINQDDDEEKSSQVAMMASIYQSAEEVIAWIGMESQYITRAFAVVDAWADFAVANETKPWMAKLGDAGLEPGERVVLLDQLVAHARKSVPAGFSDYRTGNSSGHCLWLLGQISYWGRSWILQELAFARRGVIQNGAQSITLESLMNAMKAWKAIKLIVPETWDSSASKWHVSKLGVESALYCQAMPDLGIYLMVDALGSLRLPKEPAHQMECLPLELFLVFSNFNSTDPRDKVFALFGFLKQDGPHTALLQPNYKLSVESVYSRATRYIILNQRNLGILDYHPHYSPSVRTKVLADIGKPVPPRPSLNLPSWVQDWRQTIAVDYADLPSPKPIDKLDFSTVVDFSADSSTLKVKGIEGSRIICLATDDMFPYPVARDQRGASLTSNVRNLVQQITSRGQSMLCQYLRHVYGCMNAELFEGPSDRPLDILGDLAHGYVVDSDIANCRGNSAILLLILNVLDPTIGAIRSAASTAWSDLQFWGLSPTVAILLQLLAKDVQGNNEGSTLRPGAILPTRAGDSSHEGVQDVWRRVYSSVKPRQSATGANTMFTDAGDSEGEQELLQKVIHLSLQEEAEGLEGQDATVGLIHDSESCAGSEDEEELLQRAIQLSLGQDEEVEVTHNEVVAPLEAPSQESEDEDLARAIQLSLEAADGALEVSPEAINELADFEWLGQLIDALSCPGGSRADNIRTAMQAIRMVRQAEAANIARQILERPTRPVWRVTWYQGSCPRFFVTENGQLGEYAGCVDARVGDVVARFAAHTTPFVLRKERQGEGRYRLVGKCLMVDPHLKGVEDMDVDAMKWFEIV